MGGIFFAEIFPIQKLWSKAQVTQSTVVSGRQHHHCCGDSYVLPKSLHEKKTESVFSTKKDARKKYPPKRPFCGKNSWTFFGVWFHEHGRPPQSDQTQLRDWRIRQYPIGITCLEPQTTIYKWMFGEKNIFYAKIWNPPIETSIYKWLFGVPGGCMFFKNTAILDSPIRDTPTS